MNCIERIAQLLGKDSAEMLVKEFGGTVVYFPKVVSKKERDEEIRAEYNGYNSKELARKHGLCEKSIMNIVKKGRGGKKVWL